MERVMEQEQCGKSGRGGGRRAERGDPDQWGG